MLSWSIYVFKIHQAPVSNLINCHWLYSREYVVLDNMITSSLWKPSSFFPETVKSMTLYHKEYLIYSLVPWKSWVVIFIFRWVIELGINFGCNIYLTYCSWARNLYCPRNSKLHTKVLKLYFYCRNEGLRALVFPPSLLCKWNVFNWSLALSIPLCLCFLKISRAGK